MPLQSQNARIAAAALAVTVLLAVAGVAIAVQGTAPEMRPGSPAPGWPKLATAGPFFVEDVRDKVDGRWDEAWRTLYPPHRLVASQTEFVRCERATPFELPLNLIRIVGVRRTLVHVPGSPRPVPGVAVTVRVELQGYGPRDPIVFVHRFHLVPVDGHWTWLLSASRYRLYLRDGCGGAPAI